MMAISRLHPYPLRRLLRLAAVLHTIEGGNGKSGEQREEAAPDSQSHLLQSQEEKGEEEPHSQRPRELQKSVTQLYFKKIEA